uniref:Basic tail secreted protein n=1 Tax=Rhipicephalus zambeziensis TaxID=60191 RepID=A0A224YHF7_9ACAR
MKHATAVVFLSFGLAAALYEPCGQFPTKITALDNTSCISPVYWGKVDGFTPYTIDKEENCTSTVEVMLNCTCHNGDTVYQRRYCVHNITRTEDDNTANITIGLCGAQKCHVYDYSTHFEVDLRDLQLAHILKEFPKPPCIALNMSVTSQLTAVAGCEFFCYKRENKDINDGRPCVLEWYARRLTGKPVVTLTGSCQKGICRPAESYSRRLVGECHDYDRYKSPSIVVEQCTYKCHGYNPKEKKRPDGLTCLFQRTNFLSRNVLGTCHGGHCSQVRQVDGCNMLQRQNWRTSPIPVAEECVCKKSKVTKLLPDGILCVYKRALSWTGMKLQEVGVCKEGECTAHPPDRPIHHEFKKKECKISNVQVSPQLVVAAGCAATCRRYQTEPRPNGTLCLLEYRREEKVLRRTMKTYTIGVCFSGKCLRTRHSWDIKL